MLVTKRRRKIDLDDEPAPAPALPPKEVIDQIAKAVDDACQPLRAMVRREAERKDIYDEWERARAEAARHGERYDNRPFVKVTRTDSGGTSGTADSLFYDPARDGWTCT